MKQFITTVIICVALFYILGVAGGLEQELLTFGQAVARWAVAIIIIMTSFAVANKEYKKR